MKKTIIILLIALLIIIISFVIIVNKYADTEYGKLDFKAAISLIFIEFGKDTRPPEEMPIEEQRRYFIN